jgi:hypothetical protein
MKSDDLFNGNNIFYHLEGVYQVKAASGVIFISFYLFAPRTQQDGL